MGFQEPPMNRLLLYGCPPLLIQYLPPVTMIGPYTRKNMYQVNVSFVALCGGSQEPGLLDV